MGLPVACQERPPWHDLTGSLCPSMKELRRGSVVAFAGFASPKARIARHESAGIHLENSNEGATAGFVVINSRSQTPVHLLKELQFERRKREPRRSDFSLIANGERKASNGEKVRGRAESQIHVRAPFNGRDFGAVNVPATLCVHSDDHSTFPGPTIPLT